MRVKSPLLFSLAVAVLAAWALLETWGWPIKAALYARFVTIPLLVLAITESVLNLRGGTESGRVIDITLSTTESPELTARRVRTIASWIGGYFLGVILLGFQTAVPLFVFSYLRLQSREGMLISVVLAVVAILGFHFLFVSLLHLPLPIGLLWRVLGK